jgi:hypothetical protein
VDTALTLLAVALILLPGWVLWVRLVGPQQPSQEAAITGLSFALALAMLALHLCAYLSLTVFVALWLCAGAAALYTLNVRRVRFAVDRTLVALALAAAAIRFLPVLVQEYPIGWDPNFHLLVVRLIEQQWALVTSLSPFEDMRINYPTGTHLLVALIAKCTGASIYSVYQAVLALFGSLTCLQVYAWVQAATGNRRWSLYAMAAYAFLAVQGSIGYYEWGGVPNLIGMYVVAGCLTIVAQRDAGERRWWALPAMYLAIVLSSHHVLMVAFAVMLALLAWLAMDRARRGEARLLFLGGCAAALVGVPFLAHHFLAAGHDIHASRLLTYGEPHNTPWLIVSGCGVVFCAAVAAGAVLYARDRRGHPLRVELLLPAAVMLALFALFEYGGRALWLALYQRPIAPFTPSRFITDAVYPLSAFAGFAFLHLEERMGRRVLPLVVLLFLTNARAYATYFEPAIDPDRLAAYRWVEANTRTDTLVIDSWVHAPVLTNRASANMALPSSEWAAKAPKRGLLARIQSGELRAESTDYAIVMIYYDPLPAGAAPSAVLWQRGRVSIIDVNQRVTARLR